MEFYFNPETGRVEQRAPVNTTGIAGMYDQVYGDLVDQTNAQPNVVAAPMTMDEIMYGSVLNKFPNSINVNQTEDIIQQEPLKDLGFDTSYGVANEDDEEQEFLPDQKPEGIAKLFEFLRNIPTPFNLVRRGLESLRGSESLSDFRNSRTGAEFFKRKRDREALARDPNIFKDARGITKSLASRPSSTSGGYQQGPGGSGAQSTGASRSQSQAGPGFSGSGSAAEMGSF